MRAARIINSARNQQYARDSLNSRCCRLAPVYISPSRLPMMVTVRGRIRAPSSFDVHTRRAEGQLCRIVPGIWGIQCLTQPPDRFK